MYSKKLKYLILLAILVGLIPFYKLIYPNEMLGMCKITFDQYNSSGITWTYWKMVGEITRVLVSASILVTIFAIVAGLRKYVDEKKMFLISIVTNSLSVIWFLCLTIAENNKLLLSFLAKIFSSICRIEYSSTANLSSIYELNYFGNKSFWLVILVLLIVICAVLFKKEKTQELTSEENGKSLLYLAIAGGMHLLFNMCTESHVIYKMLGIHNNEWDYVESVESMKAGYGFFFHVPVMLIVVMGIVLLLYKKISNAKVITLSVCLLLANIVYVCAGVLKNIAEMTQIAEQNKSEFYSLSLKRVILSECMGLFVFEIVSVIILIQLLKKKFSILQTVVVQIAILGCSFFGMRLCNQVQLFGVVIGVSCIVVYLIFALSMHCMNKKSK